MGEDALDGIVKNNVTAAALANNNAINKKNIDGQFKRVERCASKKWI